MVTAEGHEVRLPGRVKSFQSPRHKGQLTPENIPTQAKERLEWATGRPDFSLLWSGPPAKRVRPKRDTLWPINAMFSGLVP